MWNKFKTWFTQTTTAEEQDKFDMADEKYLIVGLGNPGRQYKENRHNIGFLTMDVLAERHGIRINRLEQKAMVGKGKILNKSVVIVKPQTFMNLSGDSVAPLARYYKVPLENILIVYDELDLELGVLRLRTKGSAGGHNGMKSLIQRLGTQEFPRLRIGISRPPGRMGVSNYVLQDFTKKEYPFAEQMMEEGADAAETFIRDGIELAMSRHNG